jgi:aryl-alcohol dehydrogenase-like predicted oxidoreductase
MSIKEITRRKFLRNSILTFSITGIASFLGVSLYKLSSLFTKKTITSTTNKIEHTSSQDFPTRKLGNTGYDVRIFSLGGQAALEQTDNLDNAAAIINRALDLGINYFDSAPLYGDSEIYYGETLGSRRNDIFLATKTHKRSYDSAMRLLEKSLQRLKTDHLDLWQIHNIEDKYDVEDIFAKDGVWKAMVKAKEEKITKNIGITGHFDPYVLKDAITRENFDTILMALNAADVHNKSFIQNLLPVAVEKNMGIIGMKVYGRGRIFNDKGINNAEDVVGYVLSLPVSTIIVGCDDVTQLEQNVELAKKFKPFDEQKKQNLENLTSSYFKDASFFKFYH